MRRFAPVLLAACAALAPAIGPALAQSPAQREAARQVERDQERDRVGDVARDLREGSRGAPALVDDMNRQRPTLVPEANESRAISPRAPAEAAIPLLSDNPQR